MRKLVNHLALLGLLLGLGPAQAQAPAVGPPQEVDRFLDAFFAREMRLWHIPGAVVVLVKDGAVLTIRGYGHADLERRTPVVPDRTVFRVGSVSKVFTATALLQLVEQGKLDLQRDVNQYLTDYQLPRSYPEPVTSAHLLTHTGGFDEGNLGVFPRGVTAMPPLGVYLTKRMPPRVRPPGDEYRYCNHGFLLAGHLVEERAGIPFAQYAAEHILRPLDMGSSTFGQPPADDLAHGYLYRGGQHQLASCPYPLDTPTEGLKTTAGDMAHFLLAQLEGGCYGTAHLLNEATLHNMHQRHFGYHPRLEGAAYGFTERWINGQHGLLHDGVLPGFTSLIFLLPEQRLGLFFACNQTTYPHNSGEDLVQEFLERCYPLEPDPVPTTTPAPAATRLDRFTGSYRNTQYSQRTLEKLATLLDQVPVAATADGALSIGGETWVQEEPLLFGRRGRHAAFREDADGRVSHLFLGITALEKLAWYECTTFQLGLVGLLALTFLSLCLIDPLRGFLTRWRKSPDPRRGLAAWARRLPLATSALNLGFLLGIGWFLTQSDLYEFVYGVPPVVTALLAIPLVTTGLTVLLAGLTVWSWWSRCGGLIERLHHTLVAVAALLFIPFLVYWNLLGFAY